MMKAKLVVVGGDAKPTEINLKLPSTVGRGREASLTLPHPLVSRLHCELYDSDGRLFVRDLGSLNGTFINNERIDGEAELPEGELLTIGTVTFRAEYAEQAEMRPPEVTPDPIDETVNSPVAGTATAPSNHATEEQVATKEQVTAEEPNSQQLDAGLDDEDFDAFDGFDDLDFEELDELGEDEEYHQEADQTNASEIGSNAASPQPIDNQVAQTVPDVGSLPAPAPPVPSAAVPTAQHVTPPARPTATPTPPAQALPSPTTPQASPVPSAQAIGPPGKTIGPPAQTIGLTANAEDEAAADTGDDDLNSFLKGLK